MGETRYLGEEVVVPRDMLREAVDENDVGGRFALGGVPLTA